MFFYHSTKNLKVVKCIEDATCSRSHQMKSLGFRVGTTPIRERTATFFCHFITDLKCLEGATCNNSIQAFKNKVPTQSQQLDCVLFLGSRKQLHILDQRTKSVDSRTSVDSMGDFQDPEPTHNEDIAALSLDALRSHARRRDSVGTGRRSSEGNGE